VEFLQERRLPGPRPRQPQHGLSPGPSEVSALMGGRLPGFSGHRLMRFLAALGQDVEIIVKAGSRGRDRGQIRVV
jgi:hypothetical protein